MARCDAHRLPTMVCKYFGRECVLESLSHICFATTEGVSVLGLNDTANVLGLHTIYLFKSGKSIFTKATLPCMLHWDQNHFVVLYKVHKGMTFYVTDPGKGLVKYSLEEFKNHWISTKPDGEEKGIEMFLEPTPTFVVLRHQAYGRPHAADERPQPPTSHPCAQRQCFEAGNCC